jgi:hypothetical protein
MRFLPFLALGLMSCAGRNTELAAPQAVGTEWKLASQAVARQDQVTPGARELGLKSALAARYEGPGEPEVTLHQMTSDPGAFEMAQKWRPMPGIMAGHKGSRFFTARSSGLDARELGRFISLLEAALP